MFGSFFVFVVFVVFVLGVAVMRLCGLIVFFANTNPPQSAKLYSSVIPRDACSMQLSCCRQSTAVLFPCRLGSSPVEIEGSKPVGNSSGARLEKAPHRLETPHPYVFFLSESIQIEKTVQDARVSLRARRGIRSRCTEPRLKPLP